MRQRGAVAVNCMARPRRSAIERAAIGEAFAAMPRNLSRRAKSLALARRVVREMVADRGDPVLAAFAKARLAVGGDPAFILATNAEIGLHEMFEQMRVARFTSRGCEQLDREEWRRETAEIEAELIERLAARFRRR